MLNKYFCFLVLFLFLMPVVLAQEETEQAPPIDYIWHAPNKSLTFDEWVDLSKVNIINFVDQKLYSFDLNSLVFDDSFKPFLRTEKKFSLNLTKSTNEACSLLMIEKAPLGGVSLTRIYYLQEYFFIPNALSDFYLAIDGAQGASCLFNFSINENNFEISIHFKSLPEIYQYVEDPANKVSCDESNDSNNLCLRLPSGEVIDWKRCREVLQAPEDACIGGTNKVRAWQIDFLNSKLKAQDSVIEDLKKSSQSSVLSDLNKLGGRLDNIQYSVENQGKNVDKLFFTLEIGILIFLIILLVAWFSKSRRLPFRVTDYKSDKIQKNEDLINIGEK